MPNSLVKLSPFQAKVYFIIKNNGPLTPKNIGLHCGFPLEVAPAQVTRPLKKLVALDLVDCERKNKRVVEYYAKSRVDPPFMLMVNEDFEQ